MRYFRNFEKRTEIRENISDALPFLSKETLEHPPSMGNETPISRNRETIYERVFGVPRFIQYFPMTCPSFPHKANLVT